MLFITLFACIVFLNDPVNSTDQDVAVFCQDGLNFNSIDEFNRFIDTFRQKSAKQLMDENFSSACVKDRDAILELGTLVSTKNVCDPYLIDELVNYHKKYFRQKLFSFETKPITVKFFTRFAIQVTYTCKKNLIKNLEFAREELNARGKVFEQARDKVYNDEPSIVANIKLLEEQPDEPVSGNVKPQSQAELTLGEYREALIKLRRPEDILTFEREECEKNKYRHTLVSKDKLELFFRPALMCHQLHRYYAGSVLSIARLANHGYMAIHEELDTRLDEDQKLKDWLIAVQVCEPMLFMQSKSVKNDWVTVDTCSERVIAIERVVYEDTLVELDADTLNEMVSKSEASRENAQKLMKSSMKKLAKADLMKQLRSGASKRSIFSKSLNFLSNQGQGHLTPHSTSFETLSRFTVVLTGEVTHTVSSNGDIGVSVQEELSDEESYKLLTEAMYERPQKESNEIDTPVSFDPVSTLITSITVLAIMLSFEWLFFIVMTVAARLCHKLYFNFENLLVFPPRFLSWSDADFARFNDKVEKYDEDDFFDFEELNPEEQEQRRVLAKVFGKPPPMLYKD